MVWLHISGQEQPRLENGLFSNDFKQFPKFHTRSLPLMANYRNVLLDGLLGVETSGAAGYLGALVFATAQVGVELALADAQALGGDFEQLVVA